jgi:type VII secretion-associated protein (TIGR03931 family)
VFAIGNTVATGCPEAEPGRLLPRPPPSRRRPARVVGGAVLAAGSAAALLAAGPLVPSPAADAADVPAGVLVQYGYRFDMPAGWEHSGGLPERRRSLLTPIATPEGSDLIAVERTPLGYDVNAEPERAQAELRATFDAAVAAGSALSDYAPTTVAGRAVVGYRQRDGAELVDWFVVLDGDSQLSIGCRHTATGERPVRAACAVVVASVRRG